MRNRYGIGFFSALLILALSVTCAWQLSYRRAKEQAQARIAEEQARQEAAFSEEDEAVAADGQALKEDCYYLMDRNGYLVVCLGDRETVYEYTDIRCDTLPEKMRGELKNGKYVESLEEVYGFLEGYSS